MRVDGKGVVVTCSSCGRSNRLAFEVLNRATRCGQCKTILPPPDVPLEAGDAAVFDAAAERTGSVRPRACG